MTSGSSPPPAPDPATTAKLQYQYGLQSSLDQGTMNHPSSYGPNGSSVWTETAPGQYSNTTTLDPMSNGIWREGQGNEAALGNIAGAALTGGAQGYANQFSGGGPAPIQQGVAPAALKEGNLNAGDAQTSVNTDFSKQVQSAQNNEYQGLVSRLNPQYQQAGDQLQSQLAAQGISGGSTAGQIAQDNFARQKNDAYTQAGIAANQAGDTEQNTLFGQSLGAGTFANAGIAQNQTRNLDIRNANNQAIQQGFQNDMGNAQLSNQGRQQGLSEIQGLYGASGGGQMPSTPSTFAPPGVSTTPVNYAGLVQNQYQNQLQNYQIGQQNQSSLLNSGLGLAGTLATAFF